MNTQTHTRWGWLAALGILAMAAMLRLPYGNDIECKYDEWFTFSQVESHRQTGNWPLVGMPTSAGPSNPALSVWVFIGLGTLFDVQSPPDLASTVQVMSLAALALLLIFVTRIVPAAEREYWLWGALLLAVNPMAVLMHRKIWPPSVLPLLMTVFIIAWWYRDRRVAGFVLGVVGAWMGQIHIPAFFMLAGFLIWGYVRDRRPTRWGWIMAGITLGMVTMIPWIIGLFSGTLGGVRKPPQWYNLIDFRYWQRWVQQSLGLGIGHIFSAEEWSDFLRYPLIWSRATYGVAIAHLAMMGTGIYLLVRVVRNWRDLFGDRQSQTSMLVSGAWWGYGIITTLACFTVHRHYLIVLFPITFVWLAFWLLGKQPSRLGRVVLMLLVIAQLTVTASYLHYVHIHPDMQGEYGPAYSTQSGSTFAEHEQHEETTQ